MLPVDRIKSIHMPQRDTRTGGQTYLVTNTSSADVVASAHHIDYRPIIQRHRPSAALRDLVQQVEDEVRRHAQGEVPGQTASVRLRGVGRRP